MDNLVASAVDQYIQDENPEREMDGKWHPSSVSSPCMKRAIYEKDRIPFSNPPGDETKRIFMMGKIIHRLVQDAVARDQSIVAVYPEVEINDPDRGITGQADILIFRVDTSDWEVIEVKSIKAAGIHYGVPKPEHVIQAGIYALVLRERGGKTESGIIIPPLGNSLGRIRFVYVVKETMEIVERTYNVDEAIKLADRRLTDLWNAREFLDYEEVPDTKAAWFKNYCPYKGSGICCGDK